MAHQVFVSYATEDLDTASGVCALLEADGIGCWMAPRDLKTETDYAAATLEAIRVSDLVLLIFSASANTSPYVLREIERAVAYERPVLSIHTDDALPNPSIEYYLNLWQWLMRSGGRGLAWGDHRYGSATAKFRFRVVTNSGSNHLADAGPVERRNPPRLRCCRAA